MKKKNFKHSGLNLNKNVISSLGLEKVKGGTLGLNTLSCLVDVDTNCATVNCGTNACPTNACPTNGCPPTTNCIPSVSCQPIGIC